MSAETETWKPSRTAVASKRIGLWGLLAALMIWPLTLVGGVTAILPAGFRVSFYGGSVNLCRLNPPDPNYPQGLYTFSNPGAMWILPSWASTVSARPTSSRTDVITPIWVLCIPLVVAAAVGVRRCRPPREGRCDHCGYDLRGTPDAGRCPECGLPAES